MGPCQIGPESFPSADIFFMHLPLALNQDHIHALLNFILYTTRAATTRFRLTAPTAAGATAARSTTFSAAAATAFATTTFVRLSFSYERQHKRRPQTPEILEGLSGSPCSFAILIETTPKSVIHELQQRVLPHGPTPPCNFAWSRAPIWRSSMRVRNVAARSRTRARKSTRSSAVK